jgi:hypothetical protein
VSQAEQRKLSKASAAVAVARGVGCSVKEQHEYTEFSFVGGGQNYDAKLPQ